MADCRTVSVYCDEAGYEKEDFYTIAGIIVPDTHFDAFNEEINCFKRKHFPDKTPSEVIFHCTDILGKKGIFRRFRDKKKYSAFKDDLSKLILERLKPKIAAFHLSKKDLVQMRHKELVKKILAHARKPSAYVMGYFFMILKLDNYFTDNGFTWKIMVEQGNNDFIKLVDSFQLKRNNFNLLKHFARNLNGNDCIKDKKENAVQIADMIAYTINDFEKCFKFSINESGKEVFEFNSKKSYASETVPSSL